MERYNRRSLPRFLIQSYLVSYSGPEHRWPAMLRQMPVVMLTDTGVTGTGTGHEIFIRDDPVWTGDGSVTA
jgi:hypothetical protein